MNPFVYNNWRHWVGFEYGHVAYQKKRLDFLLFENDLVSDII